MEFVAARGADVSAPRALFAVIPAKAGTHLAVAFRFDGAKQDQNGFRLSPE
nr:hypothetical protein [Lysobacter enzymogenes]